LVAVGGVGEKNTIDTLNFIFLHYKISKAFNIGIAGCNSDDISIGELFCTNQILKDIKHTKLITTNKPQSLNETKDLVLYDMEAKYFYDIVSQKLDKQNIFIFKIVSDYLEDKIPSKEFVKQLIKQNIKSIEQWI